MKKIGLVLCAVFMIFQTYAQDIYAELKLVVLEGKNIYRTHAASEIGKQVFSEKYKGKLKAAGNISYLDGSIAKAVFYAAGEKPKVIGTLSFANTIDKESATNDFAEREMNANEMEVYKLKIASEKALTEAALNAVPNSKFITVPMVANGKHKTYVLSQSEKNGVVIFGNDYILNFDAKNNFTGKEVLHKNMAAITYDMEAQSANDKSSSHTHVAEKGDMITPTDIAILYMYEKATAWTHHTFISEAYIYFWNYATQDIQAIPKAPQKMR